MEAVDIAYEIYDHDLHHIDVSGTHLFQALSYTSVPNANAIWNTEARHEDAALEGIAQSIGMDARWIDGRFGLARSADDAGMLTHIVRAAAEEGQLPVWCDVYGIGEQGPPTNLARINRVYRRASFTRACLRQEDADALRNLLCSLGVALETGDIHTAMGAIGAFRSALDSDTNKYYSYWRRIWTVAEKIVAKMLSYHSVGASRRSYIFIASAADIMATLGSLLDLAKQRAHPACQTQTRMLIDLLVPVAESYRLRYPNRNLDPVIEQLLLTRALNVSVAYASTTNAVYEAAACVLNLDLPLVRHIREKERYLYPDFFLRAATNKDYLLSFRHGDQIFKARDERSWAPSMKFDHLSITDALSEKAYPTTHLAHFTPARVGTGLEHDAGRTVRASDQDWDTDVVKPCVDMVGNLIAHMHVFYVQLVSDGGVLQTFELVGLGPAVGRLDRQTGRITHLMGTVSFSRLVRDGPFEVVGVNREILILS